MANLLARRLYRSLLSNPRTPSNLYSLSFSNKFGSNSDLDDAADEPEPEPEPESAPSSTKPSSESSQQRVITERPLEKGLDVGVFKAIIVGQVGQSPIQKRLKSGRMVTLLSVGTGGIRNNRRPLDNEEPKDYANRCSVQWHRVSIYPERLGDVAMKHTVPGSILYLEGNLETKIFSDPITGLVRRIREIAIRRNGRVVFLGKGGDGEQATRSEMSGVGYY